MEAGGEIQLRRVVELAGMVQHCDFDEQQSKDRDDGSQARTGLIVRLPGDKQIIIDAKAPLEGFLAAVESYNKAVNNLETRVLVSTRKLKELPIDLSKKEIIQNQLIDVAPLDLQAHELNAEGENTA